MTDNNVENLYLRGLRQIMGKLSSIERDVSDVKIRLSSLERGMGEIQVQLGVMNSRFDGMEARMLKLENHAGLIGGFSEDPDEFKGS